MGRDHPRSYDVYSGESYARQVVTYHYPVEGLIDLLRYHPLRHSRSQLPGESALDRVKSEVRFYVINFDNIDAVEGQWEVFDRQLREDVARVNTGVKKFNQELHEFALKKINERRENISRRRKTVESLSVPLRIEAPPPSLAIPLQPRRIPDKPKGSPERLQAEPALTEEQYQAVLLALHKLGRALETLPSTYEDKNEEELRDLLLMHLRLYFDAATGESINKKGKTDILISHEGGNAFVAECKFWDGPKAFDDAIDQLLGYLTWRDSKAAIVLFVKGRLQPVLDKIPTLVQKHRTFVRDLGEIGEGWYRFEIHLGDDETRLVHLTVLCYHLSRIDSAAASSAMEANPSSRQLSYSSNQWSRSS